MSSKSISMVGACLCLWIGVHIPALVYGTDTVSLHRAYIGDEGSPVNGALHILQEKSPLAVHNLETLYYGPMFAMLAVPAVVGDFAEKMLTDHVTNAQAYKDHMLFDWGGIIWKARSISLVVGFLGLIALYRLLMTRTVNPSGRRSVAFAGVGLLAVNFYYFEYTSFFRHWIFISSAILWQFYLLVRMYEEPAQRVRQYAYHVLVSVLAFGVSYLSIMAQVLFLPLVYTWMKRKDIPELKRFVLYVFWLVVACAVVVAWHPYAFLRTVGLVGTDIIGDGLSQYAMKDAPDRFSFGFYAYTILVNHVPLMLMGLLYLTRQNLRRMSREHVGPVMLSMVLVGALFYLAAGLFSSQETRYALPSIVMLVTLVAVMLVVFYEGVHGLRRHFTQALFAAYVVFHAVTLLFWTGYMWHGPVERVAIADLLSYQQANATSTQLVVSPYVLGWPHTERAYERLRANGQYGAGTSELFKAYLEIGSPAHLRPLDVDYLAPDHAPDALGGVGQYDRILTIRDNRPVDDYEEVNLLRYWYGRELWQESYHVSDATLLDTQAQ